jgi:hypothetical protein
VKSLQQQNPAGRKPRLLVLEHSHWALLKLVADLMVAAVESAKPGLYLEVAVSFKN